MWQIYVDTGGTFTDCIAQNPAGETQRIKVLSSSFLRGKIIQKIAPQTFLIETNWPFDTRLLVGFDFRVMGETDFVRITNVEGNQITLSDDIDFIEPPDFEVTSHEEAPILATRLITKTPLNVPFPPLQMRLGTTKATNALLERKGAKTVLLVTKGFKDLLRIGTQQRPHLFQLHIPEPTLLYDSVIEVNERLDALGNILTSLSNTELQRLENETDKTGCESIAVSLLHSYKNPVHEQAIAQSATIGNYSSSFSANLSPSINYLKRTQTALVNAYLQPVLANYLQNIQQSLGGQSLRIMNSAGGLTPADAFVAKDSLLSGPAGGMVGAAKVAQQLGFSRCLTFDMGGTSTDTARFDGRLDLQFITKIEDIELQNPALAIETVAAGGGSICGFDGQKLTVGPESAGANPGPACYGAGGPLTITDVNLLLGKLDAAQFGIPIRVEKSLEALAKIRQGVENKTGKVVDNQELLRGFEQIANEKMAEALRRISVAKGFDPKDYPLLTFGGAGALHGCQLADILGISTVILPYDAGLLSAFGIGQARAERILTRQILQPFDSFETDFRGIVGELEQVAFEQLDLDCVGDAEPFPPRLQIGASEELQIGASNLGAEPLPPRLQIGASFVSRILLYLRFKGQESTLEMAWQPQWTWLDLKNNFVEKYRTIFGYYAENLPIEIESIKLIASEKQEYEGLENGKTAIQKSGNIKKRATAARFVSSVFGEEEYAVYDWQNLTAGDCFHGPAVLLNPTSTGFVPAGWEVIIQPSHDAIAQRVVPFQESNGQAASFNETVELELFTNRFMAIAQEMGAQLQRTAFSVNVKERLDFSCALLDAEAELLVNAPHIPVHLGSLGVCARLVREQLSIKPGDVIITNHPKYGGSHLPDVTLLSGVFTTDNQLIGYVINRAHHAEIGGRTPGSMPPDARTLEEEGVAIVPTYLAKKGAMQWQHIEDLLTQARYPTRALTENLADINAALASLKTGELALQALVQQHGLAKVKKYMKCLKDSAFESLQVALIPYQNQVFEATETLDDGHAIQLKISSPPAPDGGVKIGFPIGGGGGLLFDFTGSSPCHPHNLNANISIIYSTILYVLRLLVNKNIPLNEGLIRNVSVVLPDDSFLHPHFSDNAADCPAVVGGNTEVSQRLTDTILKALGLAACSQGTMNNFLFGNAHFGYYETICGGTGAGEGFNGRSAVHQHMTNTRITDPEELERRYPVRLQEFSVRENSGGAGKWRGGDGVIREIAFLDSLQITLIGQHRLQKPYGLEGGEAAQTGKQILFRADGSSETMSGIFSTAVQTGDRLRLETPGGGGFGVA